MQAEAKDVILHQGLYAHYIILILRHIVICFDNGKTYSTDLLAAVSPLAGT